MTTFNFTSVADVWPAGTTVEAYAVGAGGAPRGPVLASAAVAASGSLTFTGLAALTPHVATAAGRNIRFRTGTDDTVVTVSTPVSGLGRGACNVPQGMHAHATSNNLSNGTDDSEMGRLFIPLSDPTATAILPIFAGWSGNETVLPNDVNVACSAEKADGTIVAFTFKGSATGVLKPGALLTPDEPVELGTQRVVSSFSGFYLRTFVSVTAGGKWTLGVDGRLFGASEQSLKGASVTDKTPTGSAAVSGGTSGNQFGPALVLANGTSSKPIIGLVGDSQVEGANDLPLTQGYMERSIRALGFSMVKVARGSETAADFTLYSRSALRIGLLQGCTHIIQQHATNDLVSAARTPAQLEADLLVAAKRMAAIRPQPRVYLTTCTPRTNSANTVANTAPADLAAHNAWVRDGAPIDSSTLLRANTGTSGALRMGQAGNPWTGYLDINAICDGGVDTGFWAASRTDDGTHPGTSTNIAANWVPPFTAMISGWTV